MTPQSAILPETGSHGLFLVLKLNDEADLAAIKQQCAALPHQLEQVRQHDLSARLMASIAFGLDFWLKINGSNHPAHLKHFARLDGDFQAPATGGDIFLHIHSLRQDLNFVLAQQLLDAIRDHVTVLDEVSGFRYLDSRDLTGFIDGTENPEGDERAEVGLIADGEFSGGSYVMVQRYVHNLPRWHQVSDVEQEKVIGRTKPDSIELPDEARPDTAHISRVVIEENDEELEILRHSMPYGSVSGDSGLFFLAYSCDLTIFDKMLARMFGTAGDGLHDHLLHYSQPVSGAYFFAPSLEGLQQLTN